MPKYENAIDGYFQALADPTRRAVVDRLTEGPASVKELAMPFKMALPSFMQHLDILESNELIVTKKEGRRRICTINQAAFDQMMDWMQDRRALMKKRLDALENYLDNEQLN
ncbi:ArsR/SmtB family transcription factor [Maritalea myrionectae]|uniref:ArsR/SmtB family transcription factor n=1 Tax=Maritalea myrionectae TaxID=454601 RepID=UPI00048A1838|nr:metalloregulator ArsR/SmtB family transcription factor [Maritalea myrionectae]